MGFFYYNIYYLSAVCLRKALKWIAGDITRVPKAFGIAAGLAGGHDGKNMPCIEIPCGLAGGDLQILLKGKQ